MDENNMGGAAPMGGEEKKPDMPEGGMPNSDTEAKPAGEAAS